MKVYVVTEGDYSDYCIVGVCTSKESAERIRQLASSDYHEARIEEYEADKFNIGTDYNYYEVVIFKYGDIQVNTHEYIYDPYIVRDYGNVKCATKYSVNVFAKDAEHAKKIAFDCVAKYKAEKEGIAL